MLGLSSESGATSSVRRRFNLRPSGRRFLTGTCSMLFSKSVTDRCRSNVGGTYAQLPGCIYNVMLKSTTVRFFTKKNSLEETIGVRSEYLLFKTPNAETHM